MMKRATFLLGVSLFLLSCGPPVQVRTAQDPTTEFSKYRTFAMLLPNQPVHSPNTEFDPFVMQRLRQLTYWGMRGLGYEPVPNEEADLLVAVEAARDQRLQVYSTGYSGYSSLYGPAYRTQYVTQIREGIVVVDLIDSSTKSVIWRGTGVRDMDSGPNETVLNELVTSVLARYPAVDPTMKEVKE